MRLVKKTRDTFYRLARGDIAILLTVVSFLAFLLMIILTAEVH